MLLGVDAGGTSTRAVVVDLEGRCLGYGTAGGGNPVSRGIPDAGRAIATAARHALRGAHMAIGGAQSDVDGGTRALSEPAVVAMAGGNTVGISDALRHELQEIGQVPGLVVASDVLAMFCSGTPQRHGYGLVAGTGAAVIRVTDGAITATADGLGWLLGDCGSGFWIGRRAVRAAVAALSGYGPETVLVPMLLEELELDDDMTRMASGRSRVLDSVVSRLYDMPPVELSRFAAMTFRAAGADGPSLTSAPSGGDSAPSADGSAAAADDAAIDFPGSGDRIAVKILIEARERLLATLSSVYRGDAPGPVVIGGSIAGRLPGLVNAIGQTFAPTGGSAPRVSPVPDGAVGVGVLALRHAGVTVDDVIFGRLQASVDERRRASTPSPHGR